MKKRVGSGLARRLRREQTEAERILWARLRNRRFEGKKFRRQHPIGSYIVDFFCLESNLVIELDGGEHAKQLDTDSKRTAYLRRQGYRVLRFWNNEILRDLDGVLEVIAQDDRTPHPIPLPGGEGIIARRRGE